MKAASRAGEDAQQSAVQAQGVAEAPLPAAIRAHICPHFSRHRLQPQPGGMGAELFGIVAPADWRSSSATECAARHHGVDYAAHRRCRSRCSPNLHRWSGRVRIDDGDGSRPVANHVSGAPVLQAFTRHGDCWTRCRTALVSNAVGL